MTEHTNDLGARPGTGVSRRDLFKYAGALGAVVALPTALAACGGSSSSSSGTTATTAGTAAASATGSAASGTITATAAFTLSSGFDPMNASSAVATAVNDHIFEALIDLDPITRVPYLSLAKEQPSVSADGLTWTATLRDNAKFSNGQPVTAEDVAWSFERCLAPANDALMDAFIPFIDKVTAVGTSTVVFHLKTPFSLFAERISVVKIVPKALTLTTADATKFDSVPIGSGPFTVESANATSGVVMGVNKYYTGTKPALVSKINYNTTEDDSARLDSLTGGQAQAIEEVPYADVTSLGSSYDVDKVDAFNCLFLMFNCGAAPFNDKRVRQALFYAIDTDLVINTALAGYGTAATSYLNDSNPDYQRASTVYNYDPDKAKSLLAAAGVSNLSFELVATTTGFITDSAPVIIDNWAKIGVKATLNTAESSAVYDTMVPSSSFRVLAASGDPSVYGNDADLLLRWFYYGSTWPTQRERWTDAASKQVSTLLDQASQKTGAAQKALWKQVLDVVAEEVPLYPVFHTETITGSAAGKLKNFRGASTTGLYFLDVALAS